MLAWAEAIDSLADESGFAGVVSVDRGGEIEFGKAYGLADRAHQIPNTVDTRFAIASGTKGLTALTVVSLIEDDALRLSTAARSVLGEDLPLIGEDVTVEHLLAHRSGIGDYLDEEAGHEVTDYVLTVPAQDLATTEQYLAVLDGHPAKFPPGERFSYCNGGYVVLALIAERVSGAAFPPARAERVCGPAGMRDTEFLRSDELPGRTALGYLPIEGRVEDERVPPAGRGQRGWRDLLHRRGHQRLLAVAVHRQDRACRVGGRNGAPPQRRARRSRCVTALASGSAGRASTVILEGFDAGVSFRSVHDPRVSRHPHRDLQQLRWRMAGGRAPGRATGQLNQAQPGPIPRTASGCSAAAGPARRSRRRAAAWAA